MRSDPYFHPEFGGLVPTSRLRREVRVGLLSMLFGIGIGVVAVTALSMGMRDRDGGSGPPVQTSGAGPSLPATTKTRPDQGAKRLQPASNTDPAKNEKRDRAFDDQNPWTPAGDNADRGAKTVCQKGDLACLDEPRPSAKQPPVGPAPETGVTARPTVGPSDASPSGILASGGSADATPQAPLAPAVPKLAPQNTTAVTINKDDPAADQANSTSLPRKKPQKTVRGQNVERQQAPDSHGSRESGNQGAQAIKPGRVYARSSSSPRGFWDWSW